MSILSIIVSPNRWGRIKTWIEKRKYNFAIGMMAFAVLYFIVGNKL